MAAPVYGKEFTWKERYGLGGGKSQEIKHIPGCGGILVMGMEENMKKPGLLALLALSGCLMGYTGCGRKGPAERAGEKIDETGRKIEDKIDPKGPMEKAGENMDDAAKDAKRKLEKHD
jgi:hypothetical protein